MRERINRLAKGIVDAELPKLFLSPEKAEEVLGSGTVYKRELYLASENNLYIKGLAYSNHSRVRILNHAFGGLRNHIVYEVDTSWCENGDLIKGAFTLVTNSGELEVPFLFRVETAASVQVLTTLNSAEDFAELAKKDMDMALRLMEYRDFTDAPFLKDLRIRTIYEGLKGHGNRQNALEEFFLALGVKEPIELTLSAAKKTYEYPSEVLTDKITLRKNTWGYIYIELKADGDFIELGKRVITQADFENDRMDLRFKIHPERMHKGKNLGAIHLLTAHGSTAIQIEAIGDSTIDITGREHEISKAGICRYMKLREQYEASGCTDSAVLNKIQKELDAIRGAGADSIVLTLLQAETYLDGGRPELASACLEECRDGAVREQDRMGTLYCYYQYLLYRAEPSPEKKEAVLRLFRKKLGRSKGRFYLQLLQLKLEPELLEESEKEGCTLHRVSEEDWRENSLQIAPTIITDVTWDSAVMQEELFGPILPVMVYDSLEEVLGELNRRPSPLALYLFTSDRQTAREVMTRARFGGGCVNDTVLHLTGKGLPFGGIGESGMGQYHGKAGFDVFTHYKSVLVSSTKMDLPVRYAPYGKFDRMTRFLLK